MFLQAPGGVAREGGVGAVLERAQQELSGYPDCYWWAGPDGMEQEEMARCSTGGAAFMLLDIYFVNTLDLSFSFGCVMLFSAAHL